MKIEPTDALIVVDVQQDFCPGGALPVNEGDQVVPVINVLLPKFEHVAFTRDWHPHNHCSFVDQPEFKDLSWPAHCLQGMPGAAFHPDLKVPQGVLIVDKATDAAKEAYSGFDGTDLALQLRSRGVTRVFVCGLATDYCVKATALDGQVQGFGVVVIEDACRGVDVPPGLTANAIEEMRRAGVEVRQSGDLL